MDQPCTRLLLINGMLDELAPIEDCILGTQHGSIKDARYVVTRAQAHTLTDFLCRFYPELKHMGEPVARKDILGWLNRLFKSVPTEGSEAKATKLVNGYGH